MNGKSSKKLRKLNNSSLNEIKSVILEKGLEDSKGYWNHLCGDAFWNRVKMAYDLIIGRTR